MSESVPDVFVLLLWLDRDVVFVSLSVIVVTGHWSVQSLVLPFQDVLEGSLLVPRSVCDESVLGLEGINCLVGIISPFKA